jgi:hypothetical protein
VDKAGDGDVIKVAAGKYTGINTKGGKPQVVYIDKSVTIRGGYTTTNWTTPDPVANPTTLDAQGNGRVLFITGNINVTIEGLRITGGDATAIGILDSKWGGGVSINDAEIIFRNNQVFDNVAVTGGGLRLDNSSATINGNTITSNKSLESGGGLFLSLSTAALNGNTISDNAANYSGEGGGGGGLMIDLSTAMVKNNTINSNTAEGGTGVTISESDNTILIGNTISYNESSQSGGGLDCRGSDKVTISGNTISYNSGDWAGGVDIHEDCNAYFVGNRISRNTATNLGGGLVWAGSGEVTNNVIVDNHADNHASGINITGGGISKRLLHNTVARNTGGDGSGIWIINSSANLTNNIIADQLLGIHVHNGASASLETTLWGSGVWANGTDWAGTGTINTTNNLWGNPDFVDSTAGDYHIGSNSDAIDQGVDAGVMTDIDFHPRPYQAPDIGADEYWPPGALKFIDLPIIIR